MNPARRTLLVFLSAALAAVLAVVLPLSSASALTGPAAGTRVGASHPGMILNVGSSRTVSPGQCRGRCPPQPGIMAGACVAAEAGGSADTVVLGHYPEYVQLGEKLGARTFSVPKDDWDSMSAGEQWDANKAFLDEAIANGSDIRLATPADAAREGSFYERELQYLQSQGYTVSQDGSRMVPGG